MATRTRQTEQTREIGRNQVHQDYKSVENEDGVTFSNGVMHVNGAPQTPVEVATWLSSTEISQYATVKWQDPATGDQRVSCNCRGWATKKRGQPRHCTHTDDMMGISSCDRKRVREACVQINTISQAERLIPKFEGRQLRGIMLD